MMTENLLIRRPQPSEYDVIAELWFDSWLSTGLGSSSDVRRCDLRRRLENETDRELLISLYDGQITGFFAIIQDTSKLDQLFVHPRRQRQGIGRHLLTTAKELLPSGMWLKTDPTNSKAICFYQSEGFVFDLERTNHFGTSDDVIFSWKPAT